MEVHYVPSLGPCMLFPVYSSQVSVVIVVITDLRFRSWITLLTVSFSFSHSGRYNWQEGKISGGAFSGVDPDFNHLIEKIYGVYAFQNPLHADIFPGARKMEAEIVRMTTNLFHGDEATCGTVSSFFNGCF